MRRLALTVALASASLLSAQAIAAEAPAAAVEKPALAPNAGKKPVTDREQFAYSIGYMNGQGSAEQIPDLDVETFVRGFRDALALKESLLSAPERTTAINRYKEQRLAQMQADMAKAAKENAQLGAEFFARNAKAEGITTTASGLQYRELTRGTGAKPKVTDTVKVHYEGTFLDGSVFDSSYNRGEPAVFQLDQVLEGWTEGLQLMPVGSTFELFLPSELGYGEAGAGPIPPNAPLKFKVELLGIEKGKAPAAKKSRKK